MWPELAAQKVSGRGAHRNRQIKHSENPAAFVLWKKIGDESWSDGNKSRFTNPNQRMPNQQLPISMGDGGEEGERAPEDRSENDDLFARIPVSQRPGKRRGDHVEAEKRAGKVSDLRIGEMEFALHQRLHRKQHRTVDVVKQVQRRQQSQRGPGIKFRLGHLAKEYITARIETRSSSDKPVYFPDFLFGRGHFATITVEIPPRGRKSPLTSAHTGRAHRTTSSSTRFTIFS